MDSSNDALEQHTDNVVESGRMRNDAEAAAMRDQSEALSPPGKSWSPS